MIQLFILIILISHCHISHANQPQTLPKLKTGDWVFRLGTSIDSEVIHQLGNGEFSHIGVVFKTTPQVIIIHATTDDNTNLPNQVILSTIEEFLSPALSKKYAITRPRFLTNLQIQGVMHELEKQIGNPFILNTKEQPHRYCTTIIEQAIKSVSPDFSPEWKHITFPFFEGEYLFPDVFYHYPNTEKIFIKE